MYVENLEHLVEHLAVLACDADFRLKLILSTAEFFHYRGHLDGFGPGAENNEYFFHYYDCLWKIPAMNEYRRKRAGLMWAIR